MMLKLFIYIYSLLSLITSLIKGHDNIEKLLWRYHPIPCEVQFIDNFLDLILDPIILLSDAFMVVFLHLVGCRIVAGHFYALGELEEVAHVRGFKHPCAVFVKDFKNL
jgi:hypothetical protein